MSQRKEKESRDITVLGRVNRTGRTVKKYAYSLSVSPHHAGGEEMGSGECESERDRARMKLKS